MLPRAIQCYPVPCSVNTCGRTELTGFKQKGREAVLPPSGPSFRYFYVRSYFLVEVFLSQPYFFKSSLISFLKNQTLLPVLWNRMIFLRMKFVSVAWLL